jgi:predicted nucleotidyltransferase
VIVDLQEPTRAIVPTLDGQVLAVLAQIGHPLTAGEVASRMNRGSEVGVRRTLTRLVEQGIVRSHVMGRNRVHELNRDHIASPIASALANLRPELWKRLRERLASWNPKPLYACVFGSAARGDGDQNSDIDVVLVHPMFPGELLPKSARLSQLLEAWAATTSARSPTGLLATPLGKKHVAAWDRQVDRLHADVFSWTGNRLQVIDLSYYQWSTREGLPSDFPGEVVKEEVVLVGAPAAFPSIVQSRGAG